MFYSLGTFSVEERISNNSFYVGLYMNSDWHNPVHLLVWVKVLVTCILNRSQEWHASVLYECKCQSLLCPDQSKVLDGFSTLHRASGCVRINCQALSYTSLAWQLKMENRRKAKETRHDSSDGSCNRSSYKNKIWVKKKKRRWRAEP